MCRFLVGLLLLGFVFPNPAASQRRFFNRPCPTCQHAHQHHHASGAMPVETIVETTPSQDTLGQIVFESTIQLPIELPSEQPAFEPVDEVVVQTATSSIAEEETSPAALPWEGRLFGNEDGLTSNEPACDFVQDAEPAKPANAEVVPVALFQPEVEKTPQFESHESGSPVESAFAATLLRDTETATSQNWEGRLFAGDHWQSDAIACAAPPEALQSGSTKVIAATRYGGKKSTQRKTAAKRTASKSKRTKEKSTAGNWLWLLPLGLLPFGGWLAYKKGMWAAGVADEEKDARKAAARAAAAKATAASASTTAFTPKPVKYTSTATTATTTNSIAAATIPVLTGDDFTQIEGVCPETQQLLYAAGIQSYDDLASTDASQRMAALAPGGSRFSAKDSSCWAAAALTFVPVEEPVDDDVVLEMDTTTQSSVIGFTEAAADAGTTGRELDQRQLTLFDGYSSQPQEVIESSHRGSRTVQHHVVPTLLGNVGSVVSAGRPTTCDDLTVIEGIGPETQNLLNEAGIYSFADLAASGTQDQTEAFAATFGGSRFQSTDTTRWANEAQAFLLLDTAESAIAKEEGEWDSTFEYKRTQGDDFTTIDGIDNETQQAIYSTGLFEFGDLAVADRELLQKRLASIDSKYGECDVNGWCDDAMDFVPDGFWMEDQDRVATEEGQILSDLLDMKQELSRFDLSTFWSRFSNKVKRGGQKVLETIKSE